MARLWWECQQSRADSRQKVDSMTRSNLLALAFGIVFFAWIAWNAYNYATPEVLHSPDGRPYVCKDNPQSVFDCIFIDGFQK